MDADEYWRKLEEIGWLEFVRDEERADLRKRLWGNSGGECDQRTCFVLTRYSFDWEYEQDAQSYVKLIRELALISNRVFRPENERCAVSGDNSATLSFSHGGKVYSCVVSMDTDIVDESILDLVNEAIADGGSDVQYIDLPRIDQCAYLVLVPPDVLCAAEAGLIPPEDAFDDSDDRNEQPKNRYSGFTASDIREFVERQPFQPFRITAAHWKYDVRHPRLVMIGRSSLIVGIQAPGEREPIYDRFETVSLKNIVQVEFIGAPGASNA